VIEKKRECTRGDEEDVNAVLILDSTPLRFSASIESRDLMFSNLAFTHGAGGVSAP
jgi:hypothetical protein